MKKFFQNFSLMGFLMLMMCAILGVGDLSGAVVCANGAAAPVDTSAGVGEGGTAIEHKANGSEALETLDVRKYASEMPKDPVDQKLVLIRPYDTPFDTILRYAGSMTTNHFEFGWYSLGTRPVKDKVGTPKQGSTALNTTAGSTAEDFRGTLLVNNVNLFAETQTVVPSINNNGVRVPILGADGEELQLYIYEKDSANKLIKFTVSEEQLDSTTLDLPAAAKSAIVADVDLYLLGRAASELDVTSPAVSFLPKKSKGYCQIFKTQIAQSAYEKIMDKEIKFDLSEVEEQALFEHRRFMEGTLLFGKGGNKTWDPIKEHYIYTTAGAFNTVLKHQEGTAYQLNSANGNAALVDMSKNIFTGNSGAKTRYVMGGSEAIAKISKMSTTGVNGVIRQQEAVQTEVVYGVTWSKIVTNFGQLNLVHHELFDEYGYSDYLFVIEPQFLKKWQLTNFERQEVNAKELTIMNGTMVIFTEACGVAVYNPDVHSIWQVV